MKLALALLVLAAWPGDEWSRRLLPLEQGTPDERRALVAELASEGAPAALAALAGFEAASPAARLARAEVVERVASSACIEGVLALLTTPEAPVRRLWIDFLANGALGAAAVSERLAALHGLARDDPDPGVRAHALEGIAASGIDGAVAVLDGLLDELPEGEDADCARALADLPAAYRRLARRIRSGADRELSPAARRVLLGAYGRALGELSSGGEAADERAPMLRAAHDPDPLVRLGGQHAFDQLLQRVLETDQLERADRLLRAFAGDGLDPDSIRFRRAYLALSRRGDLALALELAEELQAGAGRGRDAGARTWRAYGLFFEGAARIGLGDTRAGREAFRRAGAVLEDLLAEREDLRPDPWALRPYPLSRSGGAMAVDRLQLISVARVWEIVALLAGGAEPAAAELINLARDAHAWLLKAQLAAYRNDVGITFLPWDQPLGRDLAPLRLLLGNRRLEDRPEGWGLDLMLVVARVLRTVSERELPGFESLPTQVTPLTLDPRRDPARRVLLQALTRLDYDRHYRELQGVRAQRELDPLDRRRREMMLSQLMTQALKRLEQPEEASEAYDAYRSPSDLARDLSEELLLDGRSQESRALSERMLADLADAGAQNVQQEWMSARLQLSIASSLMDDNRPDEAERTALEAVGRLEALQNTFRDALEPLKGKTDEESRLDLARFEGYIAQTRSMLANALLSLAVNANVRQGDPDQALAYFERAYELDQSEFMQVLLACYRARSGRRDEALAVLKGVEPGPRVYYNLACTYALLGDSDAALDFLQREFAENHPTRAGLEQQKAWARDDPDLAALRELERFRRLTRAAR